MTMSAQPVLHTSCAPHDGRSPRDWSDQELLDRVLCRGEVAWAELVRRYRALIYRCITKVTGKYAPDLPGADIDEIYGEVLLALLRDNLHKIRSYDPQRGAKLGSWIGLITINTTHDFLRSLNRRPLLDRIDGTPERCEDWDQDPSNRSPLEELIEKERWSHLNGLLSEFSEKDRTFLQLYYGQGLSAAGVADEMAISVRTVYTKKFKIRQHLRQRVERVGELSAIADLAA